MPHQLNPFDGHFDEWLASGVEGTFEGLEASFAESEGGRHVGNVVVGEDLQRVVAHLDHLRVELADRITANLSQNLLHCSFFFLVAGGERGEGRERIGLWITKGRRLKWPVGKE